MGLADSWGRLWSQHRNAVLAAGAAGAVGVAVIVKRRGSATSSDPAVGYPQQITGGATPATYDTTATDAYGQFSDAVSASQDWQAQQFDALDTAVGGLGDSVDVLGRRVTRLSGRIGKTKTPKPAKAPRPKKPHQAPKAHHKPAPPPPPKKARGPVLHGGRPLGSLAPKKVPPKPKKR